MTNRQVRVRFAPSPTGPLHIGGLRTALYNYLFAKKHGGKFILRIEDTDQTRFVEGAETYIQDSLSWCRMYPDESVSAGGRFGPYRQSERKEIYQKYVQQLVQEGKAYYAFDTPDELEQMRERLKEAGVDNLSYNAVSRERMKNSFTLSEEQVQELINSGEPYVIRLKVDPKKEINFSDLIRGEVSVHSSTLDDKVLMKSDGLPTYHLANVVDDFLMEISHVIRGEEWLPSTPIHVLLYEYLGWVDKTPEFAHLPLILKPDGKGKLSKRDGDKHGFPVFPISWEREEDSISGFREAGYLSEAFVNFLAMIGWNPGGEKEIFSLDELGGIFSLDRVNKSGAKFDIEKAIWYNQQYIKSSTPDKFVGLIKDQAEDSQGSFDNKHLESIVALLQERVSLLQDFTNQSSFFFGSPTEFDQKVIKKKWKNDVVAALDSFALSLEGSIELTAESAQSLFQRACEQNEVKPGAVMQSLRLTITGKGGGPDLMKIIEIMGGKTISHRIVESIKRINDEKERIS